ncbi:transcriptional regulator/sugar kinase [Hoeflea sp. IMCC20628]|uniref:ROK family transcriptional regulator n=1 Tax=Hoeflea sp. IMCC20628 TaxID=1620421 RepID=UPI00063BD3CB|nr:ROK family transcriptional regulator [Hoeflea sp. IMCC20628]AKH99690.1 transcriptional regulator/sugar kinase [Hoeflea sp. IMCC20628]
MTTPTATDGPQQALDKSRVSFSGQSRARRTSLRTVLRAVIEHKAISRAELSRQTGLSKQTTSEIVNYLTLDGWLREAGKTKGTIGRSATKYELNSRRGFVIGADLGGTKLWTALSDLSGEVLAETTTETDPRGGEHVLDQIASQINTLARKAGISTSSILCAAIGVPGAYDPKTDKLRLTSNIEGLDGPGFAQALQQRAAIPFFVENDVTMAAKGELCRGKGQQFDSFAFLAIGTGTGLGIVSEKRLVRGAGGGAGEIAWLPFGGNAFDSRNFRSGTLESSVGSAILVQRYLALGGTCAETVAEIFLQLNKEEDAAVKVIDEAARIFAEAILAICAVLDPEIIITGGSVGSRPELIQRIRDLLPLCMPNPVAIEISPLGPRAALVGAIGMAIDRVHETLFDQ